MVSGLFIEIHVLNASNVDPGSTLFVNAPLMRCEALMAYMLVFFCLFFFSNKCSRLAIILVCYFV